ncbi:MAG: HD domain-containing protein [Chthoniobacterales bacterium]
MTSVSLAATPKPMSRIIADPIHGDVQLSDEEFGVINTGSFQRLRSLKQLGMAHLTYPNATHTRFAHSIGVLATMGRILRQVQDSEAIRISPEQRAELRLAALLHDVGHYPYSHLMEGVDRVILTEERVVQHGKSTISTSSPYPNHQEVGELIATTQADLISSLGGKERAQTIAAIFCRHETTNAQLSKLIHSSFDMDRIDYLLRDARATGVPYGTIDINYLLSHVRMSASGMLGVERKALVAVEHFLLARFFMHKAVYYHKTTFGLEECCRQLLRRIRDMDPGGHKYGVPANGDEVRKIVQGPEVANFNDAFVDRVINLAVGDDNLVVRSLASAIFQRRPPKLIKEVAVLEEVGKQPHAGTVFFQNCRYQVADLAKKHGIELGCFLICEHKPLKFEARPRLLNAPEARNLSSNEREEVIMIFNDSAEPVPIVDLGRSIVQPLSQFFYQTSRLYLVMPDDWKPEQFDSAVKALRRATQGWES